MRALIGLVIVLQVFAFAAQAAAGEDERYLVEMALWIDGVERGAPTLVVEPGKAAAVAVGDDQQGWQIELVLERPLASEGAPAGAVWLELTISERQNGDWEPVADSLLGVPEGRIATMSVVGPDQEEATPENSLVYLTARALRLRPGESLD